MKKPKYKCERCESTFFYALQFCPECCGVCIVALTDFQMSNDRNVYSDDYQSD